MVNRTRKSQSEVITTVILILIGIAAVALVSTFIISMVRNNLKSSDCFDAMGQLKINVDDGFTYYNYSYNLLFVNIARENKDFNLTGITISFGDGSNSQSVTIINGVVNGVYPANVTLTPGQILSLPSLAGSSTYVINVPTFSSSLGNITTVSIYPLLTNNVRCDKADEATVPLK